MKNAGWMVAGIAALVLLTRKTAPPKPSDWQTNKEKSDEWNARNTHGLEAGQIYRAGDEEAYYRIYGITISLDGSSEGTVYFDLSATPDMKNIVRKGESTTYVAFTKGLEAGTIKRVR